MGGNAIIGQNDVRLIIKEFRNEGLRSRRRLLIKKAHELGVDLTMGVRDFLIHQITSLPDDVRRGDDGPGYVLDGEDGKDISTDLEKVTDTVNKCFLDESKKPFAFIQPPYNNTQILSHIHVFYLKEVPESLLNGYFDCNVILDHKKETMGDPGHLARMSSCGLGVVETDEVMSRTTSGMG